MNGEHVHRHTLARGGGTFTTADADPLDGRPVTFADGWQVARAAPSVCLPMHAFTPEAVGALIAAFAAYLDGGFFGTWIESDAAGEPWRVWVDVSARLATRGEAGIMARDEGQLAVWDWAAFGSFWMACPECGGQHVDTGVCSRPHS